MALMRFLSLCVPLLFVTSVRAEDPHAPQLDVSFLAQPAPIVQYGSTRLFYEMRSLISLGTRMSSMQ
jgi:hypothetical protein